jgi:hypothetical protein
MHFFLALGTVLLCLSSYATAVKNATKPNILFLFNDDQDLVLESLNYLDSVTERIQKPGEHASITPKKMEWKVDEIQDSLSRTTMRLLPYAALHVWRC